MTLPNLDKQAAKAAQTIVGVTGEQVKKGKVQAKTVENVVTKALGVLQSQGIYAGMLFLLSRSGDKTQPKELSEEELAACYVVHHLLSLLSDPLLQPLGYAYANLPAQPAAINSEQHKGRNGILAHLAKDKGLLDNLDHLLLMHDLYEQTLIYARYGAKAAYEKDKQKSEANQ